MFSFKLPSSSLDRFSLDTIEIKSVSTTSSGGHVFLVTMRLGRLSKCFSHALSSFLPIAVIKKEPKTNVVHTYRHRIRVRVQPDNDCGLCRRDVPVIVICGILFAIFISVAVMQMKKRKMCVYVMYK